MKKNNVFRPLLLLFFALSVSVELFAGSITFFTKAGHSENSADYSTKFELLPDGNIGVTTTRTSHSELVYPGSLFSTKAPFLSSRPSTDVETYKITKAQFLKNLANYEGKKYWVEDARDTATPNDWAVKLMKFMFVDSLGASAIAGLFETFGHQGDQGIFMIAGFIANRAIQVCIAGVLNKLCYMNAEKKAEAFLRGIRNNDDISVGLRQVVYSGFVPDLARRPKVENNEEEDETPKIENLKLCKGLFAAL